MPNHLIYMCYKSEIRQLISILFYSDIYSQQLNDGINNNTQQIGILEDNINQNRAIVNQINNSWENEPSKLTLDLHMHKCTHGYNKYTIILGHFKLHFCFWSWIFPRTMWVGATSASQPPIQVNERWYFVVKMFAHRFAHALCKLLRMLKNWKLPEACGWRTRNRSTTWRGLMYSIQQFQ